LHIFWEKVRESLSRLSFNEFNKYCNIIYLSFMAAGFARKM